METVVIASGAGASLVVGIERVEFAVAKHAGGVTVVGLSDDEVTRLWLALDQHVREKAWRRLRTAICTPGAALCSCVAADAPHAATPVCP